MRAMRATLKYNAKCELFLVCKSSSLSLQTWIVSNLSACRLSNIHFVAGSGRAGVLSACCIHRQIQIENY